MPMPDALELLKTRRSIKPVELIGPAPSAAEIETLRAQAEVQPLISLASQLSELKTTGEGALRAYVRNVRLCLFEQAKTVFVEARRS